MKDEAYDIPYCGMCSKFDNCDLGRKCRSSLDPACAFFDDGSDTEQEVSLMKLLYKIISSVCCTIVRDVLGRLFRR